MTDRHSAIFYFLLAAMTASLVGYLVEDKSFYEHVKKHFIHLPAKG